MRKIIKYISALSLAIICFLVTGCGYIDKGNSSTDSSVNTATMVESSNTTEANTDKCLVSFDSAQGTLTSTQLVAYGEKATEPIVPSKKRINI